MITFTFNEMKTIQTVALLLGKSNLKMNYMKLIKLLYLIDREALTQWERPITGDTYVSMRRGPVLSNVLDLINYDNRGAHWYKYISAPCNYEVELKDNPGQDLLSKREIEIIEETYDRFKDFDQWEMVDICHDILPEWKDPGGTSIRIDIEDILEQSKTPEEIEKIKEEIANIEYVKKVLATTD